jgi:hypothetical protein
VPALYAGTIACAPLSNVSLLLWNTTTSDLSRTLSQPRFETNESLGSHGLTSTTSAVLGTQALPATLRLFPSH